ncbi:hypothetical protein [Gracilimonas halophila]|uniref:Uncharacterized protein n=1 Tax=Gracilimonas halophila TaxID=1834464 RepID=A0ABW5JML0_9BACT
MRWCPDHRGGEFNPKSCSFLDFVGCADTGNQALFHPSDGSEQDWIARPLGQPWMGLWIQAMQDPSSVQDDDLRWGVQYSISNTE